ncbi:Condensin complex subunit 3 [Termitomyces sp. J132]|nr:Condensin complex subunit 3 [Termitomyces sp. J132]
MPGRTLYAGAAALCDKIAAQVPRIFDQAQNSLANHQKNLVALYKLQVEAALCTEEVRQGRGLRLVGEKIFEEAILQMLTRVLPLKKGVTPADRVVKFIGGYVKFVNEKALEQEDQEGNDEDDESTASRFTARLLQFFYKGFLAKDKNVRYRSLQSVAEMVNHLGLVDEEVYSELRSSLMDRVIDREVNVRVQVAIGLSKLSGTEGPSEEGEQTVQELLLDIMKHDASADVRRAAVLNIPIDDTTIDAILDRTRDVDITIRKLVYSAILEKNVTVGDNDQIMGPTHPRALTIAQRELIIRNGLGDREPSVRAAAASLLGRWVDVVGGQPEAEGEENPDVKVESGLIELLKMLDMAEQKYPVDAVLSVLTSRPEIFQNMIFGHEYWKNLTPETAFLARVFVEHGLTTNDNVRLEAVLPVVTELAFHIQDTFNELSSRVDEEQEARLLTDLTEDERIRYEDARLEKEAILGELLQLAVNLDYSDEIGRRKMFQLVRDMLSEDLLPQSLLNKCLDVLRELSPNERDLIRVVVELVQDLRDQARGNEGEEDLKVASPETSPGETPNTARPSRSNPPREQTAEEKARADATDYKCLLLCIGMLERVDGTLDENSTLAGILDELIIPSVKRKEYIFREKGLISMGLCCLIAKPLAINTAKFFVEQVPHSPASLQESLLQITFDIMMVHEAELRKYRPEIIPVLMEKLLGLVSMAASDKVRAVVCLGLSKLILAGMATDYELVLTNLIQVYLSPKTENNLELRQCLTFFFQVFCYSSPANQETIRSMFLRTYETLKEDREKLDEDEEMISPAQITTLFADWTDPNKLRTVVTNSESQANMSIQLDLAIEVLRSLLEQNWAKEDKKVLCQLLPKLYLPDSADDDKVKELKVLVYALRSRRPIRDTMTNNAFTKFEAAVMKKFGKQLQDFNEEEYRKLEQLEKLFSFVDSIIPDDDDEEIGLDEPKRKGKKRHVLELQDYIMTTTTEADDVTSAGSSKRGRSKPRSKRPRLSNSDDASDDEVTELHTPPPPTRKVPKRSAATRKPPQVVYVSSSADEDYAPTPRSEQSKKRSTNHVKNEEHEDVTFDSIIDGDEHDDENEEEEVHDLLAEE